MFWLYISQIQSQAVFIIGAGQALFKAKCVKKSINVNIKFSQDVFKLKSVSKYASTRHKQCQIILDIHTLFCTVVFNFELNTLILPSMERQLH